MEIKVFNTSPKRQPPGQLPDRKNLFVVMGKICTDHVFRSRYISDPEAALLEENIELSPYEASIAYTTAKLSDEKL